MDNSLSLFAMTSEWMESGNINEFIEAHQDANRFELVGFYSYYWWHKPSHSFSRSSKASPRG